ncbi:Stf0 family sulfotransferase [Agrobacterium tumefaciens]|uniref:Stf0 family sulfotransferase n=1 Tax=Agrobacterium tumefaciens TaxID=358 RepID=UPI00224492AD|nr:Stf0 family sulfotransferase [Agrobacterium tumefaciens]MCW8060089.1 Stf0 family sulfotransferase [Agrobacterium tumefaciens]
MTFSAFKDRVFKASSDSNGNFFIKIFPRHLFYLKRFYPVDFVRNCLSETRPSIVILERRDRLRQAVSFSRALQTSRWTSEHRAVREARYDFDQIARCYFVIGRSYDFWHSYTLLSGLTVTRLFYEDLLEDISPFARILQSAFDRPCPELTQSELSVQRDNVTEEWIERFSLEAQSSDFLRNATPSRPPQRTARNLFYFLSGRQMKPTPYSF